MSKRNKDEQFKTIVSNPQDFAKAIAPYLAQIIVDQMDENQEGKSAYESAS